MGTTAGFYVDGSGVQHGFVRSPDGKITEFDPPGPLFSFASPGNCLSLDGTVTGSYNYSSGVIHGFVRQANGTITSFDPPAAATLTTIMTIPTSINPQGVITGYFLDSSYVALHGFLRYRNGSFTTFDDPDAGGQSPSTASLSINFERATTGQFIDASNNYNGFERLPDGRFANFEAPKAAPGSVAGWLNTRGTRPSTNN